MANSRIAVEHFLSGLPVFGDLDPRQIERLALAAKEFDAPRGSAVYRRGDPCHGLHVVVHGQIKLSLLTGRGDEMVVELIGPGMSFGEAPLFARKPHILAATALADSTLLHIGRDAVLRELERDSGFARAVIDHLGDRLYRRLSEFEEYVLASGTERVISFLLRAESAGPASNAARITLPASKGVIASRLHLTHEHFSRILRALMIAGLIEVEGREVRILDRERLYGYVS